MADGQKTPLNKSKSNSRISVYDLTSNIQPYSPGLNEDISDSLPDSGHFQSPVLGNYISSVSEPTKRNSDTQNKGSKNKSNKSVWDKVINSFSNHTNPPHKNTEQPIRPGCVPRTDFHDSKPYQSNLSPDLKLDKAHKRPVLPNHKQMDQEISEKIYPPPPPLHKTDQELLKLRYEFDCRKDEYLNFIHKYDPTFKFKEYENLQIKLQLTRLDQDFCSKCDSLTENYESIAIPEQENKLKSINESINLSKEQIKESQEICLELEEALKKSESELYIDSDLVYSSYKQLREYLEDYFKHETEHVNHMIQILLDQIITKYSFDALKPIEELFISSKHENWISHAKKQIVTALLDQQQQEEDLIDTDLIINTFKEKYNIEIKLDENLKNAILISHQLSKYAIANDYYFKYGLTLEGLELLNLKDQIEQESKELEIIEPPRQASPEPLALTDERSSPPKYIPSSEPIPPLTNLTQNNDSSSTTTSLQRTSRVTYSTLNDQPNRIYEISALQAQEQMYQKVNTHITRTDTPDLQLENKKKKLKAWKRHINESNNDACVFCRIYIQHRSNEKNSKAIDLDCTTKFLCSICKSYKDHIDTKCQYKSEEFKFKPKCKTCQELRSIYQNKKDFLK